MLILFYSLCLTWQALTFLFKRIVIIRRTIVFVAKKLCIINKIAKKHSPNPHFALRLQRHRRRTPLQHALFLYATF